MKLRGAIATLSLIFTLGFVVMQSTPASAATPGDFIGRINNLRASKGLSTLSSNGALSSQAQMWAEHMAGINTISHNPNLGGTPGNWTKVGENVGTGGDVDAIFNALVASPAHYRNMVDPDFNSIGVGIAMGSDGRIYTCHVFAAYPVAKITPAKPAAAPTASAQKSTSATVAAKKSVASNTSSTSSHAASATNTTTTVVSHSVATAPATSPSANSSAPIAATSASTNALPAPSPRIVTGLREVSAIGTQG